MKKSYILILILLLNCTYVQAGLITNWSSVARYPSPVFYESIHEFERLLMINLRKNHSQFHISSAFYWISSLLERDYIQFQIKTQLENIHIKYTEDKDEKRLQEFQKILNEPQNDMNKIDPYLEQTPNFSGAKVLLNVIYEHFNIFYPELSPIIYDLQAQLRIEFVNEPPNFFYKEKEN